MSMLLPLLISALVGLSLGPRVFAQETGKPVSGDDQPSPVPSWADPKMTSDDAEYGVTKEKAITLGSPDGPLGGPKAEEAYLKSLRDAAKKGVRFRRLGSTGPAPDGHILDAYEVSLASGKKITLYIDMYHSDKDPAKQPAPKGLYKLKK